MKKNFIFIKILLIALTFLQNNNSITINTSKKFSSSNSEYRKVLRSDDGINVYQDVIKKDERIDNELDAKSLLDNFYDVETTCDLSNIENVQSKVLNYFKKYDKNASFVIPQTFDPFDDYSCVVGLDKLLECEKNNIDIQEECQHFREDFFEYVDLKKNHDDSSRYIPNTSVTLVNIFVPGIGGKSSHWSNDGNDYDWTNSYIRSDTLPYKVAQKYDSNIFVARPTRLDSENIEPVISKIWKFNESFKMHFSNLDAVLITDGSVLLYEDKNTIHSSNENFYNNFENFMCELMELYPNAKFNLFGHSRGGDINLMFASEYNDKVNNIFSLGTPYYSPVLANLEEFINDLPDEGYSKIIKNFVNDSGFKHLEAYSSLANENKMHEMRENWNKNKKSKLYSIGYTFNLEVSWFVHFLWWQFRIDMTYSVPWDVLVGTYNAMGLPIDSITLTCLGSTIKNIKLVYDLLFSDPVECDERIAIGIDSSYIFDVIDNDYKYLCSAPGSPMIPHNLETMYSKTINTILGRL